MAVLEAKSQLEDERGGVNAILNQPTGGPESIDDVSMLPAYQECLTELCVSRGPHSSEFTGTFIWLHEIVGSGPSTKF